jgi:hypothetical protein
MVSPAISCRIDSLIAQPEIVCAIAARNGRSIIAQPMLRRAARPEIKQQYWDGRSPASTLAQANETQPIAESHAVGPLSAKVRLSGFLTNLRKDLKIMEDWLR